MYLPVYYIREDENFRTSKFYIINGKFMMSNNDGTMFGISWDKQLDLEEKDMIYYSVNDEPFIKLHEYLKKLGGPADFSHDVPPRFEIVDDKIRIKMLKGFYYKFPVKNTIPADILNTIEGIDGILTNWDKNGVNINITARLDRLDRCFSKDTIVHLKYEQSQLIIEDEQFEVVLGESDDGSLPKKPINTTFLFKNIFYFLKYAVNNAFSIHIQMLVEDDASPLLLYLNNEKLETIKAIIIAAYEVNDVENGIDSAPGLSDIPVPGGGVTDERDGSITILSAETGVEPPVSSSVIETGTVDSLNETGVGVTFTDGDCVTVKPPLLTGSPPPGVKVSFDEASGLVIWEPDRDAGEATG